jgi:dienelactone hydrolase
MEKDLNIKVDARYRVYGRLAGSLKHPVIVIVHGLPCSIYEGLYEDAAQWFASHGYAVYRFNLYSWQKDARQLIDCTLKTHADDLDAVIRYFRKRKVQKTFVAGHSFGAPTILTSQEQRFDAAALWDGSFDISFVKEKYGQPGGKFIRQLNGYFMRWGSNVIIGRAMAYEIDQIRWDELTKNFHKPLNIIAAGKGILVKGANKYFAAAREPKSIQIIKGATHFFDDTPNIRIKLFRATKHWFDKF